MYAQSTVNAINLLLPRDLIISKRFFHFLPLSILLLTTTVSCEKDNPLPSLENGFNAGFGYVGG